MRVFLSWSGQQSHDMAQALNEWLPHVINAVKPWLSSQDIDKGARWFEEIGNTLQESSFGIICLTAENIKAPWILFEAGALSKSLGQSKVCPLLTNIKNADLQGPLAQFNTAGVSKDEILKLLKSLNSNLNADQARTESQLDEAFNVWWPKLESKIESIANANNYGGSEEKKKKRPTEDILEEILSLSRQTATHIAAVSMQASRTSPIPDRNMTTIIQFAAELGLPPNRLLDQLLNAGLNKAGINDTLSESDKKKLLDFLKASHGARSGVNANIIRKNQRK